MKAPAFKYERPDDLEAALALLADNDGSTQILAGGQSLMATLNMRLSSPTVLLDINRIDSLRGIEDRGDTLRIGALVRHAEVLDSALVAQRTPLLSMALPHVAHMAVRNRGTTCGSLALADPSAEMPAVAVTLDATLVLEKHGSKRTVPARAFFQGLFQTARDDDEMITEVIFPHAHADDVFGFSELSRRHGDFAVVGVAMRARNNDGALTDCDIVVFGSEPAPLLSPSTAEFSLTADTSDSTLADMAETVAAGMEPMDNHQGRGDTKRRQAAVLLRRTLKDMQARTFGEGRPS